MCATCALSVYVSDDVDCRALGAPLAFVIVTKCSEQSWFFPLPEGV